MARAWVRDRWIKDAVVDGYRLRAPGVQRSNLSKLEDRFKTTNFGKGQRWRVEWFDDSDGPKKLRSKAFSTRDEAEEFQAALEDDTRSGRYVDPKKSARVFSEAASAWLSSKVRSRDSSKRVYTSDLNLHVLPKWGQIPLNQITSDDVQEWISSLLDGTAPTKSSRNKTPLSETSVNRIVTLTFGGVIRNAIKKRWIQENPLSTVELPRPGEAQKAILSAFEVELLASTAGEVGSSQDSVLVRFLAYCGVRIGEAVALRVEDLRLSEKRAHISKTVTSGKNSEPGEGPTKNWAVRDVPIPETLLEEIKQLVEGRDPSDYVFTTKQGCRINLGNWRRRVWIPALQGSGLSDIPGLTPHSLRHTCASLAIRAGIDVRTLSSMLGHKKPSITLDIYSHLWPNRLDDIAAIMESERGEAIKTELRLEP